RRIAIGQPDHIAAADLAFDGEAELFEEAFDGKVERCLQGGAGSSVARDDSSDRDRLSARPRGRGEPVLGKEFGSRFRGNGRRKIDTSIQLDRHLRLSRSVPHWRQGGALDQPNSTGSWRGPRTWPDDQRTLPAGSSLKSGIRFSHSSSVTFISSRPRLE